MITLSTDSFDLTSAYYAYLNTIATAQRRGETAISLTAALTSSRSRLNQQWSILERLAEAGLEPMLRASFEVFLREWAVKEAVELLLVNVGTAIIDPTDVGLQGMFWGKLGRQRQALAAELTLFLEEGKHARAQVPAAPDPDPWNDFAFQVMEEQQRQQMEWQGTAFQLLQEQQRAWDATHRVAQDWSNVALDGAYQARQGAQQVLDFAREVQTNANALQQTMHDQQRGLATEVADQVTQRRFLGRVQIVGVIILLFLGIFGCAFFAAGHLLFH